MGRGMRENITQLKEFFIVASKKQSFASTALLFIVWVFKFHHWYGCRYSWKSESQKLHKCLVFHAYSLHTCQNRGRAEYLPAMLSSSCIAVAVPILSKEQFGLSPCLYHFSCFRIPRTRRIYGLLTLSSFNTMGRHNWKNLSWFNLMKLSGFANLFLWHREWRNIRALN